MLTKKDIFSAEITSNAHEKVVSIFVEVETENSCDSRIKHALKPSNVCKKPFVILASVLPFTYNLK